MSLSSLAILLAFTVGLGVLISLGIVWVMRRRWAARDEREDVARWSNNGSNRYRV